MEHLCAVGCQSELVSFLKRAIITTTLSGTVLTVPIIICFSVTMHMHEHESVPRSSGLILWAFLRISLFCVQLPLRFDVWRKLNECRNEHRKLLPIVHSTSWKLTQTGSFMVSLWLIITILYTLLSNAHTDNYPLSFSPKPCFSGNVSVCLLRWSLCTVFIFGAHILFIVCWLRKVLFKIKKTRHLRHYQLLNRNSIDEAFICSICKQNDEHSSLSNVVVLNQCSHQFHQICIDKWFDRKKQCPLCLKLYGNSASPVAGDEINIRVHLEGHQHYHTDSLRLRHCSRGNSQMLHFFMPN